MELDAVIATNTTIGREGVEGMTHAEERGGLSGRPLAERSTEVIARLHARLGSRLPIIGAGGIFSGADALGQVAVPGPSLVQIYTGFIYRGPKLIDEIVELTRTFERCS